MGENHICRAVPEWKIGGFTDEMDVIVAAHSLLAAPDRQQRKSPASE